MSEIWRYESSTGGAYLIWRGDEKTRDGDRCFFCASEASAVGAVTYLNALASERDAAVREAGELRKALQELQRRIPYVNGAQTANLQRWHRIITDSLTATTGGSAAEGITE